MLLNKLQALLDQEFSLTYLLLSITLDSTVPSGWWSQSRKSNSCSLSLTQSSLAAFLNDLWTSCLSPESVPSESSCPLLSTCPAQHCDLCYAPHKTWALACSQGFLGRSNGKESACSAGDLGWNPGSGRSPGEGNGYPLQYSGPESPMDRAIGWATAHGVPKNWTRLSDQHFHFRHMVPHQTRFYFPIPNNRCSAISFAFYA